MTDWKKTLRKIFSPPVWLLILLVMISTAALILIFAKGWDESVYACMVYVLAFYTLCAVCTVCGPVFPKLYRSIRQMIYRNRYGNRYMTDAAFRTHFSLYLSLSINLLYVATNLLSGIWYRSVWSITLAAYYIILAVMRFLLIRFANQVGIGKDRVKELRRSRLCGMILMTVNLALSGVVALVIMQNQKFEYPGMLIYIMAMYTFYVTIHSVISIIKYRRYDSPVMSAAKAITLAAALVSMLSLATAMLSQFGTDKNSLYFNRVMIGTTGAGVCAIVVAMSVIIMIRTNRELKKLRAQPSQT